MFGRIYGSLLHGDEDCKHRALTFLLIAVVVFLGIMILGYDYYYAKTGFDGVLERNDAGMGDKTESFQVQVDKNEKVSVDLEISEVLYNDDEILDMFSRVEKKLDKLILGENKSLDRIESDMNLVTNIEGEPVEITWELQDYSVMLMDGELILDALDEYEDGFLQELKAVITYTEDETKQESYRFLAHLYKPTLSDDENFSNTIIAYLKEYEQADREKKRVVLPDSYGEKAIGYFRPMDTRGVVVLMMAPLIGILLVALEKEKQKEGLEERKKQMIRDYPELLLKLTIFIGAGMTAKRAWKQIVKDYETQKHIYGQRYVYDEMALAIHEMESGITEANSYLNFGRRCNTQEYIRFSAILSQNLRKGTRGLTELLRTESIQAFEERKANARRLGEEAGTKLLLPMFFMLGIVLVIVMVPAFLSMNF